MANKEATARIKINKLLEVAGWRFFAEGKSPANIQLEPSITIKTQDLDALGENFEKSSKGFIDFLLLNEKGFPFIVLEAKAEDKSPLVGKEQARKYARSQNCRFIILSNGNLHYFWDLERGNPYVITTFPTPSSVMGYQKSVPDPKRLVEEAVDDDYIVLTQRPNYAAEAAWKNVDERSSFIDANSLRLLRLYQKKAIVALQSAVKEGKDRFLFEMATGTGNGNIFYSEPSALDCKITEIMRVVDEIQTHSKSVIEHCYQNFLLENNDADDREYADATDQIREVLIHQHYLSQKDIEICLGFDLASLADRPEIDNIRTLHEVLKLEYGSDDERGAS